MGEIRPLDPSDIALGDDGSRPDVNRHPPQTVALVDWNWTGHHPTYFKFYTAALAELGVDVVPFLPFPEEMPSLLSSSPAARNADALARIMPAERCRMAGQITLRPRWLQRWQQQASHFHGIRRAIRRWEAKHNRRVDLVFFACIYEPQFTSFRTGCPVFGYDWAGLNLHARRLAETEQAQNAFDAFKSPRLRGVAVLDEALEDDFVHRTRGKRVVTFPDLTDTSLPSWDDPESGLARKVLEFARGRPVVSLLGHLRWSKGFEAFTRAAADPRLRDVLFFVGGEVSWDGVAADVRRELMTAWERLPNVYAHLQRIDERPFNAVLAASDIVYAAYIDFPFSSNVLTKAAFFEKPIIVSKGHLMGARVERYRLGVTVPQLDTNAVVEAILTIRARTANPDGSAGFKQYAAMHSYDHLKSALRQLLLQARDTA